MKDITKVSNAFTQVGIPFDEWKVSYCPAYPEEAFSLEINGEMENVDGLMKDAEIRFTFDKKGKFLRVETRICSKGGYK